MRILMLAQFYPPTIGGEERHVQDLSVELVARGHDVAVATLWRPGTAEFEVDRGVRIHRIRGSLQRVGTLFSEKERQHSPPFPDPEALWALRRIIEGERPDIVHAHNWMVHSFTPLKAWSRARLVVTLHDCSLICAQKRFVSRGALCSGPGLLKCLQCAAEYYGPAKGVPTTLANWAWGKVERRAVDMFLPVSQAMVEVNQLARFGVPHRVIPNFIPDRQDASPGDGGSRLKELPRGDYLLFVGDVARDKGVEVLLQAFSRMESSVPLVLIGRPVEDFRVDFPPNVYVLHSWPHEAVMQAWSRCTVALVPSICLESFGLVALEAMAMGRPVVASRIGGLADIVVDGQTGFLVTPGDACALRDAVQRLLSDPILRERMGKMAKQRAAQFHARSVVPRIESVYQEVLCS